MPRPSLQVRSTRSNRLGSIVLAGLGLAGAGLLLAPSPALAAPETYNLDPEHTTVGFKVQHFFSKVPGRFNKAEGTIVLDQSDLSKSTVNVSIDASSVDTNEPARDKHLRSDAFFDVAKHPKITFQSTKVRQVGPNKLQVDGNLTIRGTTKPVTLEVDVLGFGPDAWGGYRAGFEARTKINRLDYGVSWNDVIEGGGYILGNDVEITLNVEAVRQKPKPAEAPKKSA